MVWVGQEDVKEDVYSKTGGAAHIGDNVLY